MALSPSSGGCSEVKPIQLGPVEQLARSPKRRDLEKKPGDGYSPQAS
jgi:hypothetical protein